MWNQYTKQIQISFLPNKFSDDFVSDIRHLNWGAVVSMLSEHDVREEKDGLTFMPIIPKEQSEWTSSHNPKNGKNSFRLDSNIDAITMAVIDLDKPGALEDARRVFKDFDYVVYSTHSYNEEHPYKSRMVLRLEDPILSSEWNGFLYNLAHCIDLDVACKNYSRNFYMPSIHPSVSIPPLFEVNEGRGMRIEDSLVLKDKFKIDRTPDQQKAIDKTFAQISQNFVKGKDVFKKMSTKSSKIKTVSSFDYEDLLIEYDSIIRDTLRFSDSRYQFAQGATFKCIMTNGMDVDWHNFIQFMYRVTLTEGTKQLQYGNTRDDLESCITGAYMKWDPQIQINNPKFISETMSKVYDACNIAEKSMVSGVWHFNESENKAKIKNPIKEFDDDFLLENLKSRNSKESFKLARDGDVIEYITSVFKNELSSFGSSTDINTVGQFAFLMVSKFLSQANESIDLYAEEIRESITIDKIDPNRELDIPEEKRPDFNNFIKTSLILGHMSATKQRKFELKKQSPEKSLEH